MVNASERLSGAYRVYRKGIHPKPKRHYYPGTFAKRQQALNFCRRRAIVDGLVIVHPEGREEPYMPQWAKDLLKQGDEM